MPYALLSILKPTTPFRFIKSATSCLVSQIAGNLDEVTDIKFLNDNHIVMATNSPQLKVFDLATGSTCLMQGHKTNIVCVTVCAKEQLIATGDKVRTCCET